MDLVRYDVFIFFVVKKIELIIEKLIPNYSLFPFVKIYNLIKSIKLDLIKKEEKID